MSKKVVKVISNSMPLIAEAAIELSFLFTQTLHCKKKKKKTSAFDGKQNDKTLPNCHSLSNPKHKKAIYQPK